MLVFVIYMKIRTVDLDSPGDDNQGNNYVVRNDVYTNLKMKGMDLWIWRYNFNVQNYFIYSKKYVVGKNWAYYLHCSYW